MLNLDSTPCKEHNAVLNLLNMWLARDTIAMRLDHALKACQARKISTGWKAVNTTQVLLEQTCRLAFKKRWMSAYTAAARRGP